MKKMSKKSEQKVRKSLEDWAAQYVDKVMTYITGIAGYESVAREIADECTSSAEAAFEGYKKTEDIEAYATILRRGKARQLEFGEGTVEAAGLWIVGNVFDDDPIISDAYLSREEAISAIARSKVAKRILNDKEIGGRLHDEAYEAYQPDGKYLLGRALLRPYIEFPELDAYIEAQKKKQ